MNHDTQTTRLQIVGMTCASCVSRLEKVLARQPGVISASVNLASETAHIRHSPEWNLHTSIAAVRKAGFDARQWPETSSETALANSATASRASRQTTTVVLSLLAALALMLPMLAPFLPTTWWLPLLTTQDAAVGGHPRWPAGFEFAISTPVQWIAGATFMRGAIGALRNRQANMDVLVVLGSLTAWTYSTVLWLTDAGEQLFFEAGVAIIAFVLLGKWLEKKARDQTTAAIAGLQTLRPEQVERLLGSAVQTVALSDVHPGDRLRVAAGQRLACDGVVVSGQSHVDESALTGESMPVSKTVNDTVRAGSLNLDGELVFEVHTTGRQTLLGQVIDLIESAQGQKLPVQQTVDRVAAVFVPAVLLIATLTGLLWGLTGAGLTASLMHAVTVIVVACPCALGLATPAAIMAGTGAAARAGLLIRDPRALHLARQLQVVVFDKTGTLTQGKPALVKTQVWAHIDNDHALALAAGLQMRQGHPLGDALRQAALQRGITPSPVQDRQLLPGIGTRGRLPLDHASGDLSAAPDVAGGELLICHVGHALSVLHASDADRLRNGLREMGPSSHTLSVLLCNQRVLAVFEFADPIRADALAVLTTLKARGMRLVLLSGDRPEAVKALTDSLPLDEAHGSCTPSDKAQHIRALQARGLRVGMVGDGINDAPAMALADLAIAMGGGTDLAAQTAHITLMRADLHGVVHTLSVAQRIHRNIQENLFWAFAYNVVCIPLAALGWFSPMMAAAAMALSSVSVVANALRLTRWTPGRG